MYSSTPFRRSSSTTTTFRASGRGARAPLPETRDVVPAARPGGRAGLRAAGPSFRPLPGRRPLTGSGRGIAFRLLARAALVLLVAGASADAGAALGNEVEIERSPADPRVYRAITLANGLEALVVSDPSADKAAAALDLNAGSADDPDARPGMAHFLEHMLFLGTEKYPDPGEYNRFITEHGGFSNASTSFAHTSYFFEVDAPHLEGALDRFAHFFITPRFDREYLAGERRIVHSEYVSRSRSDHLRSLSAWKQALDPRHPLARFHVGTEETLAERPGAEVRDELIAFYERTYSAHLMKLVVLGREPLDDLERFVRTRFEVVKRRPAERLRIAAPLFREGLLPARLAIEPIRETRTLSLSFAIPPLRPHYRAKPVALISHLVGHEGGGSLLSALKERGWAEGLSAGPGVSHPDFATFGITVRATEAGIANADEVVALVFAYLDLVRADGLAPRYRDELARMAELDFRFMDKAPALDHTLALAAALHLYPVGEVLAAPYRYDEADPALERRFLAALTPDRVLVTVIARGVTTDSVSPFFEAPYRLSAIPPEARRALAEPGPGRRRHPRAPRAESVRAGRARADRSRRRNRRRRTASDPHRPAPRIRAVAPRRRRVRPAPRELPVHGAITDRQRLPTARGAELAAHPNGRGTPSPSSPTPPRSPGIRTSSTGTTAGSRSASRAGATSKARCSRVSCRPCARRPSPRRDSRRSGRNMRDCSETWTSARRTGAR